MSEERALYQAGSTHQPLTLKDQIKQAAVAFLRNHYDSLNRIDAIKVDFDTIAGDTIWFEVTCAIEGQADLVGVSVKATLRITDPQGVAILWEGPAQFVIEDTTW